jgi:hypothetical protein
MVAWFGLMQRAQSLPPSANLTQASIDEVLIKRHPPTNLFLI